MHAAGAGGGRMPHGTHRQGRSEWEGQSQGVLSRRVPQLHCESTESCEGREGTREMDIASCSGPGGPEHSGDRPVRLAVLQMVEPIAPAGRLMLDHRSSSCFSPPSRNQAISP